MRPSLLRHSLASLGLMLAALCSAQDSAASAPLAEELLPQLRPVLEQALRQSPRMLDRNLELLHADAAAYVATARLYPSVTGYLHASGQNESREDTGHRENGTKLYYNINATQPVWHWGVLKAGSDSARLGREIAGRKYDEAWRLLALEVRAAYLQLVLSKMAVRNTAFNEGLARQSLERLQARVRANEATGSDLVWQQLGVDEHALSARRAEADLGFALRNFRRLTGLESFSADDIPAALPVVETAPATAAGLPAPVLAETLRTSDLEVERARLDCRASRFNLYPRVNLTAGTWQDEISYSRDLARYQTQTFFAGVQVHWNLFDSYSTRGQKLAATTRLRQAERAREALRDSLRQTADSQASSLGFAWEAYRIAQVRARAAANGLAVTQDNFRRGLVSQEQLDASQASANQTQYNATGALVAMLNASAQYASTLRMDPFAKAPVQP